MEEGFFSEGIAGSVLKQIQVRQTKLGKSVKTPEELAVLHENTAWAVLRAGIMTPKDDKMRFVVIKQEEDLPEVTTADAQNAVLGGELQQVNVNPDTGVTTRVRPSGIQLKDNTYGYAYRKTTHQGHRPVAGITGVSVRTLDTWGMILEATVNIKVWSRDELEDLDRVYFKPGFPALLEWGHTLYFNDDGTVNKQPRLMVSDQEFFRNNKVAYSYLDKIILEKRKTYCNQEACFGYITNFSYSFQKNGSWDCTLKILSKGAVLKNLQLKSGQSENVDSEEDAETYSNRSIFHAIHRAFSFYATDKQVTTNITAPATSGAVNMPGPTTLEDSVQSVSAESSKDSNGNVDCRKLPPRSGGTVNNVFSGKQALLNYTGFSEDQTKVFTQELEDFPVIRVPIKVTRGFLRKIESGGEYYITLRSLLYIINKFNSVNGLIGFDLWSTAKYVATPNFVSLNPYVVVVPAQNSGVATEVTSKTARHTGDSYVEKETKYMFDYNPVSGTPFRDLISWEQGTVTRESGAIDKLSDLGGGKILNLWINYGQFIQDVEAELQNPDGYSIENILKRLLSRIQKALGNLSLFQIVANQLQGGSLYEIVDLKCIQNSSLPGEINITGLENTVTNLTIQSDVSPEIANTMCIAAQAPKTYEEGFESTDQTMVHWGENCQPIWVTGDSSTITAPSREDKEKKIEDFEAGRSQWYKDLAKAYETFRSTTNIRDKSARSKNQDEDSLLEKAVEAVLAVSEEKFGDLQLQGEKYRRSEMLKCIEANAYSQSNLQMGIIPIRVGFTMMGIGRITVGTTFRVKSGVLPRKYDDWGYIVTGVDHSITRSGWTTTLKTQYYPIYWKKSEAGTVDTSPTDWDESRTNQINKQVDQGDAGTAKGEYRSQSETNKAKIDAATSLFRAFTQCSGFDWGGSQALHYCAWYATGWAHAFVEGKEFLKKGIRVAHGLTGPACQSSGNGNDSSAENFCNGLPSCYKKIVVGDKKKREDILKYAATCKAGDILIYYDTNYRTNGTKGHAQFCLGNGYWVSDFKHSGCVYQDTNREYRLLKFTPSLGNPESKKHPDWKTIG